MSFGFSVGDFMQGIRLVNDIRCRIIDAPGQWKGVAEDVKALAIALQEANCVLPRKDLSPSQEDVLGQLQNGTEQVLEKLRAILDHAQIVTPAKGKRSKINVIWKSVLWDQKEVTDLRNRIALNLDAFNTLLQQVTSNAIFEIKADVAGLHERADAKERDKERKATLNWLSSIDHVSRQRDIAIKRHSGTGLWLLNSPEFIDWHQRNVETLLCQGIPGTGKTVLASVVVSHLIETYQDDPSVGIAYLYFTYQPQQEQVLSDLLGSLVKQLIPERQSIPTEIEELFNGHRNGKDPMNERDLRTAFSVVMKPFSKIFIVIDALDEYHASAPKDLEDFLTELLQLRTTHPFSLFATSRYVSEITSQLGAYVSKEIRAHDDDLLLYINARIGEMRWKIFNSVEIQESIRKEVLKAADGMFLLARLHMDTIVGQPTIGDLEDALENLPKGLDELNKTYDQAMQRIDGQPGKHRELAYKILIWVIHTKRALSTWEIRDALAIKPGQPSLNYKYRPELETINSLCAGLITVDANSEIVRLVHYTTKEYFTKKQVFPNADAMLAEACITCIAFDAFQDGSVQGLVPHRDSVIQPRIYEYAAHFWGYHAKAISYRDNLVFSFLNHTGKASACAQLVLCQGEGGQLFSQLNILGIHLTALLGLQYLMDVLIENGQSPSAVNKYGHTPLWFAAWNGKCDIVQYLITQCGIKSHEELQKPFLLAIDRGHYDIVDFILPFIDPQTLTYSGEKRARIKALPLSEAAQKGHLRIVELLLKDGRVELNYQDRDGYTALHDAIVGEQEPVAMRLLTTRGVDPGLQNNHGATPFLLAARHGLLVVVEHLLKQKYVDYNVIDSMGRSAFLQAVEGGHSEIVDLLLGKTKVQPDIEDLEEETAISHPIRIGYLKIEPDIMDFNQRTAISYAAQGGHLRVLNTLLEYDIPGDTKDKDGRTPFWYAASEGHLEAMKFLLSKYIVSPNTEDKNGQTPFSIAAKNGHTQVLVFLYSNCNVDVDSRDQEGYTPLTHAISGRHMQNGDYLLSIGADLQTRDKVGRTLLDHSNDEKIIELLLRKGAGPDDYAHEVAVRYFGLHSEIAKLVKARVTS